MEIDRNELQDSARKMFASVGLAPDADKTWSLIVEAGWLALTASEDLGGLEQGRPSLALLYSELGRILARAPFLPTMLAVEAVIQAEGFSGQADWFERIVGGEIVTAALLPGEVRAATDGDGFKLTGKLAGVQDADNAGHVLVVTDTVVGLLPLDGAALEARRTWDATRRLFDVGLEGVSLPAELVLAKGEAAKALARELAIHLDFAVAADSMGGAAALLDLTVEYLQTRKQFARPLAMFQALKHRCADLRTLLAAGEALLWRLADETNRSAFDPQTEAAALKSHAASVYLAIAEEAIQLHGGIGLTAEHPCHLFMKRAFLNSVLGEDRDAAEATAGREALARLAPAA